MSPRTSWSTQKILGPCKTSVGEERDWAGEHKQMCILTLRIIRHQVPTPAHCYSKLVHASLRKHSRESRDRLHVQTGHE